MPTKVEKDAITGQDVPVNGGTISLKCGPELYRYVKIATVRDME